MANISEEKWIEILEKKADGSYIAKYPKVKSKSGITFDEHLAEKATLETLGHVKPDGQTIVVDEEGVLSSPMLKNTFFYQSSNEYPAVTGGWTLKSNISSDYHTKGKQVDRIYMSIQKTTLVYDTGRITMSTRRKISMANISKLKILMSSDRTPSYSRGMIYFGLKEDISDISDDSFVARFVSGPSDNITIDTPIELDVSSLSGEYYLEVRLRAYKDYSASVDIYSIWGES